MIAAWLLLGSFLGGALIAYARTRADSGRRIAAIALIVAAGIYVGIAILGAGASWIVLEVIGLLVFSLIAILGLKHSLLWLASGWIFHAAWDVCLHLVGPGAVFTPESLAMTCVSFDLLIAAYIVGCLRRPHVTGR